MKTYFRFYEELNDFLTPSRRKTDILVEIQQVSTVKDIIESLGVPHTEVDLILINGVSEPFSTLLKEGDHVSVYPIFESVDIAGVTKLRRKGLREHRPEYLRFVVDVNLGKLAHWMRMFGFDVTYAKDLISDELLARISNEESRILLTRDRGLLKRKNVDHGYFVRAKAPKEQIVEVLKRFDLLNLISLCSRCMNCNVSVKEISAAEAIPHVPPLVAQSYSKFFQCPQCHRIYWEGTHYENMQRMIADLKRDYFEPQQELSE